MCSHVAARRLQLKGMQWLCCETSRRWCFRQGPAVYGRRMVAFVPTVMELNLPFEVTLQERDDARRAMHFVC